MAFITGALSGSQAFYEVFKKGRRIVRRTMVVHLMVGKTDDHRILTGFVITKKTGNAVRRNRVRRQLRAIISGWSKVYFSTEAAGICVVVRIIPGVDSSFSELKSDLETALDKGAGNRVRLSGD